jgi:hypothetical protein
VARSVDRLGVGLHRICATLSNHDVGPTALLGARSAVHGVEFLELILRRWNCTGGHAVPP